MQPAAPPDIESMPEVLAAAAALAPVSPPPAQALPG